MRPLHPPEEIRAAEAPLLAALPDGTLMQRAAAGLARRCAEMLGAVYGARVVLVVGSGNNGGDALYAGALLAGRGAQVDALLAGPHAHPGGVAELRRRGGRTRPGAAAGQLLARADLVVDGLVGIGARGGLREPMARLAAAVAAAGVSVVAVDLPSGVDAATGAVEGAAVRADVTVTFGAAKPGLLVDPGAGHAGRVEVVDIGLTLPPPRLAALDAVDVAGLLPVPSAATDKYRRGVVGVAAGSDRYPGAGVLAVGGAAAAGAGMVRYAGAGAPVDLVRRRWPEALTTVVGPGEGAAVVGAGRVQAWVVGSGLGTDDAAAAVVRAVLATDVPVVVDADGITVLADHPDWLRSRAAPTLLTPHAGEFARLTAGDRDDVEAHRLTTAVNAAGDLGCTILLKGSTTVVAAPDGQVRVNTAQTPYLATAGSGDVLSGVCGALLAAGLSPLDAGAAAAFLHGLAGVLAAGVPARPITAGDLVTWLPAGIAAVGA